MAKDPWFKFYPTDWEGDTKLQSCSLESHGLLIKLMCMMHESERPGYLLINGSIPELSTLCRVARLHHKTLLKNLKELLDNGVLRADDGAIYCPRMVKDHEVREQKSKAGKLGGNPVLLKHEDKREVKPRSQKPDTRKRHTTSVSVFSLPEWMPKQTWDLFLDHRKKVKAPVSEKAYQSFVDKFGRLKYAGWPPEKVVDVMTEKGWRWFKPDWVAQDHTIPPPSQGPDEHAEKVKQWQLEQEEEGAPTPEELAELHKQIGFVPDFGRREVG